MDPRLLLAITLISIGQATWERLREIWKEHGASDADLDILAAEVDRRIARRQTPPESAGG